MEKEDSEHLSDHTSHKETIRASKISLIIDTYDDIFSDFDPRPYTERALSTDFIDEARRASRDKASGVTELNFLIPARQRNLQNESLIKHRLHDHFKRHHSAIQKEINSIKKRGLKFTFAGIVLGAIATVTVVFVEDILLKSILLIFLEPGSWYTIWTGLDQIFFSPSSKKSELQFYEKMMHAEVTFQSY